MATENISKAYDLAREQYASIGIDTDHVMDSLSRIPISLHCWQGDDVGGFETDEGLTGGGIQATGNYPGKARNADELRSDLDKAYSLIPGDSHKLNLHALYAETNGAKVERNNLKPEHFSRWIDWAKQNNHGIDFNPSFFSHPLADDGFTLSSRDEKTRRFWIEHGIACRKIGEAIGQALDNTCVTNLWIPDGYKDTPIDRLSPRVILTEALDAIFEEPIDPVYNLDAVESKLFGIGSESYVVGSHEFYFGYALKNQKLLCLDAGHFHPTEMISEKISSCLLYLPELLLHVSRGVRWDSDHVVILSDELRAIAEEIVRNGALGRVHIGLDFFDASINRIAAWVIGTRAMIKALLIALLEPTSRLKEIEREGDFTSRLAYLEELKNRPWGAVWDYYCEKLNTPVQDTWVKEIKTYENQVLSKR